MQFFISAASEGPRSADAGRHGATVVAWTLVVSEAGEKPQQKLDSD